MDALVGHEMHRWATALYRYPRSLTGNGVRQTVEYLQRIVPNLTIIEVPSGTRVMDWIVPDEWNLHRAWIEDDAGNIVLDSDVHNLHVVGYSTPIDTWLTLDELDEHLHSLPDQPDAIPYVTSYYQRRWGFCLADNLRKRLRPGRYRAVVDAELQAGSMTMGELVITGETDDEVLLSTYICHPMMANNELSGPVVAIALARHIEALPHRRLTYRFSFVPETLGALAFLSRRLHHLKSHVRAGYVITCVGDERTWSYLPSRAGNTLADRAATHVLRHEVGEFHTYSFLDRGSDERQYCAPGVDLPVASVMRSKYATYPEYHTSLDDLELVTPSGLQQSFDVYVSIVEALEANRVVRTTSLGEPQLGRRGLYPTLSATGSAERVRTMMNLIAYADGSRDLLDIAETIGTSISALIPIAENLLRHGVLSREEDP